MKKVILFILIVLVASTAYAEETYKISEPSQAYLDYISLPEEEQNALIEPFPVDIIEPQGSSVSLFSLLPEKYDPRESGSAVTVRNQKSTGLCWAFAADTAVSAFLKLKYPDEVEQIFSARHMENSVSQNPDDLTNPWAFGSSSSTADSPSAKKIDEGGNSFLSTAYFMNGNGPVLESLMPFKNNTDPENTANIYQPVSSRVLDVKYFSGAVISSLTEAEFEDLREEIKKQIMSSGSVNTTIYMEESQFSSDCNSYYYSSERSTANHAILLIGWDDTYPKENFTSTPSRDGAWIVQNSWGSGWGDEGYFYVSYDEASVYLFPVCITDAESSIDYDNRYIYDRLGWNGYYPVSNSSAYAITVFQKPEGTEALTEVTFGNEGASGYEIYVNPSGGLVNSSNYVTVPVTKMTKVAEGSLDFSGYKTVKLDTPIELTGTEFTVAVKYISDSIVYIPVEIPLDKLFSMAEYDGESYYYNDKEGYFASKYDCSIKAFTKDVTPKTDISFKKSDENLLVYMTDKNGFELIPKADGTYSVLEGEYDYTIKAYNQTDVTGVFNAVGDKKTLYAYLDPVDITEAGEVLNQTLLSYGQTENNDGANERLARAVGSTFNFKANDDFSVTRPTDTLNGKLYGSVTLYDTFRGTSSILSYDGDTVYKARLMTDGGTVTAAANSNVNAKLIIAQYDESETLTSAVTHSIILAEGETETVSYTEGNTKIFLWDMDRIYPYAIYK